MNRYGLIGYPLEHSFSKAFFTKKFRETGISHSHIYELFEMESLKDFPALWERHPDLKGINVTIPHKVNVIDCLDRLDSGARKVGAVNVIKKENEKWIGYNSDYIGFKRSLEKWIGDIRPSCLILGSGGASLAVRAALDELHLEYDVASRHKEKGDYLYTRFFTDKDSFGAYDLIINTTPMGMSPNVDDAPPIPYDALREGQYVYDLIYNPAKTLLLREAEKRGAFIKNGIEMLTMQAERAWEIWTLNHGL